MGGALRVVGARATVHGTLSACPSSARSSAFRLPQPMGLIPGSASLKLRWWTVPPQVAESHRDFVAGALRQRLRWQDRHSLLDVAAAAVRDGRVRVEVSGSQGSNALPFELNVNARIDADHSVERLRNCFSISVKFGAGRQKPCVARLDAQPSRVGADPRWHLHRFDPQLGLCIAHDDQRIV